jgi:adenylate cyclase
MNTDIKTLRKIIILSAVSFGISLAIFSFGMLDTFEFKAYDLFSRNLNPDESYGDIVIVHVDQQSLDSLSDQGINWPWPRQIYAPLIEYLSEADAVFIDILFTEASMYGQQDDQILADAFKKASNVYLPVFLTNNKREIKETEEEFLKKVRIKETIPAGMLYKYAITPLDIFKPAVRAGNVTIPPDKDGIYRKVPLVFKAGDLTIPHFILDYLLRKGPVTLRDETLYTDGTEIPLVNGMLNLRYSRKERPFVRIPAADILRSYLDSGSSEDPVYRKEYFMGKKVFIGLTAPGLYDLKPTSMSSISTGVSIHAATLENIIDKNFLRTVNSFWVVFFMFVMCVLTSSFVLKFHSIYANLSVFFISLAVTVSIPAVLFMNAFYMNIIFPSLSFITAFIIAAAYSYATEGKERRFVKRAFLQYMDRNVVEHILKNPELIKPGGQKRRVTVFFTDIAGFTSLAEKIPAEETARILHTILNSFTETIINNRGVIDKYIGDCIMAFWGAPLDTEEDEINACYSALQCIESLHEINRSIGPDRPVDISVRVGIHTGNAVAGNLGSDRLFDYTVIGDTVNLASRLESANKYFGTKIIVTEETLQKTGDIFFAREIGLIAVKGKSVPVRIFELIAENEKADPDTKEAISMFTRAMDQYNKGELQEALDLFRAVLEMRPQDGPSEFYIKRCEDLMSKPELTSEFNIIKLEGK